MVNGGKFALQLFKNAVGFVAALICAALFLAWGLFQGAQQGGDPVVLAVMVGTGLVTASVLGGFAMVPAFIAITVAEMFGWRSVVYHVGIGGLIALGMWTFDMNVSDAAVRPGTTIALAAGFLAGGVYWLIAGRTSGRWHSGR
ncbi:translation initiation factor IF-3 [Roseibium algae]|uniref:Translation initiation factor IF-3 n=1 Tax=Roseibium algae TaxID=3123038 RepID=A0ABU8TNM5_9HYPH